VPNELETPLGLLLARLANWLPLSEFEAAMQQYFSTRSATEVANYRAKSGNQKKLRDEVAPVLQHVRFTNAKGEIRFQLSDGVPDCWLRDGASAAPQGIEVTVALAREQQALGKELNDKGIGRGFLGLPDNAAAETFARKLASPRIAYSSDDVLRVVTDAVTACLVKKSKPKYTGHDLLIEAPLHLIPRQRWSTIQPDLHIATKEMPFRQVHVVGDQFSKPFGFRIK
jgi:hypothetical protein